MEKPLVMILMGGAGSNQTYHCTKKLVQSHFPLHILACVGRKTKIIKKIEKLKRNPAVSLTCIPFTDRISDLMAVSDLLITKPGPATTSEAAILKLPVILDATATNIFWERGVAKFVLSNNLGREVKSLSKLNSLVEEMLFNKKIRGDIMASFDRLPPYRFNHEIMSIIKSMCPPVA